MTPGDAAPPALAASAAGTPPAPAAGTPPAPAEGAPPAAVLGAPAAPAAGALPAPAGGAPAAPPILIEYNLTEEKMTGTWAMAAVVIVALTACSTLLVAALDRPREGLQCELAMQ
ncbi:hypothetical protein TSOC_011063 [Tetrabaena socialis]|uniref:Uncharacterized protein n=1 Tax=Tetrabaena socialis TaxID=47790 RepID=A0A2J7ZRN9_9CHLO|nr:hypothetical protein TSOC_011063 [Tetrabaena socialis]|eukprot:PNH02933.1 hypothetical protein TSOC_011063 [Tetrabaena socialis]